MTNMSSSIPLLFFKGTHYELGFKMVSTVHATLRPLRIANCRLEQVRQIFHVGCLICLRRSTQGAQQVYIMRQWIKSKSKIGKQNLIAQNHIVGFCSCCFCSCQYSSSNLCLKFSLMKNEVTSVAFCHKFSHINLHTRKNFNKKKLHLEVIGWLEGKTLTRKNCIWKSLVGWRVSYALPSEVFFSIKNRPTKFCSHRVPPSPRWCSSTTRTAIGCPSSRLSTPRRKDGRSARASGVCGRNSSPTSCLSSRVSAMGLAFPCKRYSIIGAVLQKWAELKFCWTQVDQTDQWFVLNLSEVCRNFSQALEVIDTLISFRVTDCIIRLSQSEGSRRACQVKLMHLEREVATQLGLFQTVMKDMPIGCTDFLINNSQEVRSINSRLSAHSEACQSPVACAEKRHHASFHQMKLSSFLDRLDQSSNMSQNICNEAKLCFARIIWVCLEAMIPIFVSETNFLPCCLMFWAAVSGLLSSNRRSTETPREQKLRTSRKQVGLKWRKNSNRNNPSFTAKVANFLNENLSFRRHWLDTTKIGRATWLVRTYCCVRMCCPTRRKTAPQSRKKSSSFTRGLDYFRGWTRASTTTASSSPSITCTPSTSCQEK